MRHFLYTPRKAWQLAITAVIIYASAPMFAIAYYSEMQRKGAYPPDADSLGIPFYYVTQAAKWLSLPFLAVVLLLVWRYPGSVPLRVWNSARPVWSWAWTILFGVAIAAAASSLVDVWRWKLPLELLNVVLWVWLLLAFRAVVVARLPRVEA